VAGAAVLAGLGALVGVVLDAGTLGVASGAPAPALRPAATYSGAYSEAGWDAALNPALHPVTVMGPDSLVRSF